MNLLHIDSSALGAGSVSRELTAAITDAIAASAPRAEVTYRDLVAAPIGHLDATVLAAIRPAPGSSPSADPEFQREAALTEALLQEFLAADVVVVGAPMYNFSVPSQLKAWIDRIAQAGRTFRYTEQGPQGLAGGKRVIIVSSRGGQYAGTAFETAMDHQEAYLRAVFGFFGITDITVLRAEGVAMGPAARAEAIAAATAQGREVVGRLTAECANDDAARAAA
ncbi:MAG: FMN-dependent NADH-azoreductase [Lautropia sp.]